MTHNELLLRFLDRKILAPQPKKQAKQQQQIENLRMRML